MWAFAATELADDAVMTAPAGAFTLLPAVDVADGRRSAWCRARRAPRPSTATRCEAALAWQADGRGVGPPVDLDAAFGRGSNAELLAEVVRRLDVAVELSGGIRDDASLEAALATGCARVNIGTAALESPDWVRRRHRPTASGSRSGLDVRGSTLAAPGLDRRTAASCSTCSPGWSAEGCPRYVVTDVDQGRHADRPEPRACSATVCARRTGRPVGSPAAASSAAWRRPCGALA